MGYHKRSTLKSALVQPRVNFDQNVRIIIIGLLLSAVCDFISVYRMTPKRIIDFTFQFNEIQDESETSKYLRIILSYKRNVNYADRHVLPPTRLIDLTNMSKTIYQCINACMLFIRSSNRKEGREYNKTNNFNTIL